VETDARGDRGEPAGQVLDGTRIGALVADPCFLHCVVGVGERTERLECDRPQMRSIGLEDFCVHSSHSLAGIRHTTDESTTFDVTRRALIMKSARLVVYPVQDLDAAKAFYTQTLGAEPYGDSPYYV